MIISFAAFSTPKRFGNVQSKIILLLLLFVFVWLLLLLLPIPIPAFGKGPDNLLDVRRFFNAFAAASIAL